MYADQIIYGTIYTGNEECPEAHAAAVKDGVFIAVGEKEDVASFIGPDTEVTDYEKGCILPSFCDGHAHATTTVTLAGASLYGLKTVEEYLQAISSYVKENPDKKVYTGKGYISGVFDEVGPRAEMLDRICNDGRYMILYSEDCHSTWVNSACLRALGITKDSKDPKDGRIVKDPVTGEPTGWLIETAQNPVEDLLPPYTVEDYKEGILTYQKMALSQGITRIFEPFFIIARDAELRVEAYRQLEAEGALHLTVRLGLPIQSDDDAKAEMERAIHLRELTKDLPHVRLDTIKLFTDGVIENHTAFLRDVYCDSDPALNDHGEPLWTKEALNDIVTTAVKNEFHVHIHCIGDAASDMALDAFEAANAACPGNKSRFAMTHLQILHPEQIKRMVELKVFAVVNPYWHFKDPLYFPVIEVPYLGEERAEEEYPMKALADAGLILSQASDFPVTVPAEPFTALQLMVNRKRQDYMDLPALRPEQALTVKEAVSALTLGGCAQMGLSEHKGMISVDKDADYIMIDSDAFKTKPTELYAMKVLKTVIGGREVWSVSSNEESLL